MQQDSAAEKPEYVIVEFPEEKKDGIISMALVSSTWLFEENGIINCFWPTYLKSTLSREKTIKNHLPILKEKCIKCVVLIKEYDNNYERAAVKLRKLEEESELSSNTDVECEVNRKLQSNRESDYLYYNETDDDDEENIPKPPKFPIEKKRNTLVNLKPVKEHKNVYPSQTFTRTTFDSIKLVENHSQSFSSSTSNSSKTSNKEPISSTYDPVPIKCQCEKNTNMLERVLRDLQIIKMDIKNLTQMSNNDKYTSYEMLDSQLNFQKYEELQEFENKLNDQDFFTKMQASICLLGGRDLQDTTRKIVSLIISHNLALKLTWRIASNEKGSLQKLEKLLKLIYGAVRRNPVCSNATNSEIETAIRNWIKNAPDRQGGRANRKKTQTN